jgi:cobalt-zinc-cadmium efflux system protein
MIFHVSFIDPMIAILLAGTVISRSLGIFKGTFLSLMDAAPSNLDDMIGKIMSHKVIKSIHDIHIIAPSSKDMYFSAHVVLAKNFNLEKIEALFEELRCHLDDFGITHSLFQPETEKYHAIDNLCRSHALEEP